MKNFSNSKLLVNCQALFSLCIYMYICALCVLSCFSHNQLFATPWTVACQAPLFMGFFRQEY